MQVRVIQETVAVTLVREDDHLSQENGIKSLLLLPPLIPLSLSHSSIGLIP